MSQRLQITIEQDEAGFVLLPTTHGVVRYADFHALVSDIEERIARGETPLGEKWNMLQGANDEAWALALAPRLGILIIEAQDAEILGRFDWLCDRMASDVSFERDGEAALDAVHALHPVGEWEQACSDGTCALNYQEWVEVRIKAVVDSTHVRHA